MSSVATMSPQETSQWCASLSQFGVKGPLLRALQCEITGRGIDGKRFEGMLRENALHQLGVEGLNPKMAVGIRKAWNTDFAQVTIMSWSSQQGGGNAQLQPQGPTPSASSLPQSRIAPSRLQSRLEGEVPSGPGSIASTTGLRQQRGIVGPGNSSMAYGGSDVPERQPAQLHGPGSASNVYRGSDGSERQPAQLIGPGNSTMVYRGEPALSRVPDPFPTRDTPAAALAPPYEQWAAASSAGSEGPHMVAGQADRDGGLENAFAPRRRAPNTFVGQHEARDWDPAQGEGVEDTLRCPQGQEVEASDSQDVSARCEGLESVFAPRPKASNTFAAKKDESSAAAPRRRDSRQSEGNDWASQSLSDALGAKKPAQNRYGPPSDEPAAPAASSAASRPRPAKQSVQNDWAGVSLSDALAPRKPASNRYSTGDQTQGVSNPSPAPSRMPRVEDSGNDWGGVSLGDALGSAKPQAVHVATSSALNPSGPPSSYSALDSRADAQGGQWEGSLGDVLGRGEVAKRDRELAKQEPRRGPNQGSRAQGASAVGGAGGGGGKTTSEIVTWLRTLPESHVPEAARESIVEAVEQGGICGNSFTTYVQTVPPEICGPKHAMKLKAAWKNVLAETEAQAICRQNLDYMANAPANKAVKLTC